MTTPPAPSAADRRARRHAATRDEIVACAWALSDDQGLAAWTLRDVAEQVGMRAPSLYGYVSSKSALYDAMFADGQRRLLAALDRPQALTATDPVRALHEGALAFFDFCVAEPARFTLLFQRAVPGFTPSAESLALAQQVVGRLEGALQASGVEDRDGVDLWTAMLTGLASQQVSNEPGGTRWRRLVRPAVELLLSRPA